MNRLFSPYQWVERQGRQGSFGQRPLSENGNSSELWRRQHEITPLTPLSFKTYMNHNENESTKIHDRIPTEGTWH